MRSLSKPVRGRKKLLDNDKGKDLVYLYNYPLQVQKAIQRGRGACRNDCL